jgi:lysophospholipase L1-like esterase
MTRFQVETVPNDALKRVKKTLGQVQTAWSILGITVAMVLFMEGSLRALFAIRDSLTPVAVPDRRVIAEGYRGAEWPVIHYRELERLQERWQPFVYFRQRPFRGETINIDDDGLRATWRAPDSAESDEKRRPTKILMLGGSSLWGYGSRDAQTIPSLLARTLHDRGKFVEIRNLAEIGYVSTQEVIALVRELAGGYRPDLVIFYDGVNDTTSALLEGEAAVSTNEVNRREEFNLLQSPGRMAAALTTKIVRDSAAFRFARMIGRRIGGPDKRATKPSQDDLADEVVRRYEANIELVESLGDAYGFRSLFFWQPTVFTKEFLADAERDEAMRYAWTEPFFREVHAKIKSSPILSANRSFHDQSAIFSDKKLVFIDYCHTTETANALIAAQIATLVIENQSK